MASTYRPGAVSIFAVIFATLLLTVLTVGFIGLMISAQQRAINNDLSQSAYDAALAGVEDAKRVVRACASGDNLACEELEKQGDCEVIARAGINGVVGTSETRIASSATTGEQFDQAYTCVNITMDSPSVELASNPGKTEVVSLRSVAPFQSVVLEWYASTDTGAGLTAQPPTTSGYDRLPKASGSGSWAAGAPPLLRAQIISPGESFSLSELDESDTSSTVFFRPSDMTQNGTERVVNVLKGTQARATEGGGAVNNSVVPVRCSSGFANSNLYSCRAVLRVGTRSDDVVSIDESQNALLRLDTMYAAGATSIKVSLRSDLGSTVNFNGVQPVVDSTGRANDLFRRVRAHLGLGDSSFPYPTYAVDVANDLCKNFSVDIDGAHPGGCTP